MLPAQPSPERAPPLGCYATGAQALPGPNGMPGDRVMGSWGHGAMRQCGNDVMAWNNVPVPPFIRHPITSPRTPLTDFHCIPLPHISTGKNTGQNGL